MTDTSAEIEEVNGTANEEIRSSSEFPASANRVWDFAHALKHCVAPIDEACSLLKKTIQASGGRTLIVKSYQPSIFTQIRASSGVSEQDFQSEWDPAAIAEKVASKGAGKSGSLFVSSKTGKYLLKTLRKEEKDALKKMARELAYHFDKYPGSLLSRQYALCRVQTLGVKRYFVVFNNLFHGTGHVPTNIYDLKGSTVNRKSKATDLAKADHVRMDLDYPRTFEIDTDLREQLLEQIRHDADFLARYNIMDYSLLVGVVKTGDGDTSASSKKKKKSKKHKSRSEEEITEVISPQPEKVPALEEIWRSSIQSRSEPSQERFVFGIIDILQEYNTFKKAAHVLKVILFRTIAGLSTVPAKFYANRFKTHMENKVLT